MSGIELDGEPPKRRRPLAGALRRLAGQTRPARGGADDGTESVHPVMPVPEASPADAADPPWRRKAAVAVINRPFTITVE